MNYKILLFEKKYGSNFNLAKLKKLKLTKLSHLSFIFLLLLILACSDDNQMFNHVESDFSLEERNSISKFQNMLYFKNLEDFKTHLENLQKMESDISFTDKRNKELNDILNKRDTLVTQNPICELEEKKIKNFKSARKLEEETIFKKLEKDENVFSIVIDPYLKTYLNKDYEIKIGERFYKVFEDGLVLIVEKDLELFRKLSASKSVMSIRQGNGVVITNTDINNWDKTIDIGLLSSRNKSIENKIQSLQICIIPSYLIDIVPLSQKHLG